LSWLNSIFDNSKEFEEKITLLQKRLSKANALNLSYEEQLAEKKQDIKRADKSIQKIIHIWKNINSSESLPKVLAAIINGLSNDLDFLYCLLFQIYTDKDCTKLKVSVASDVTYFNMEEILGNKLKEFSIPYESNDNILVNVIKSQEIKQVEVFHEIFKGSDLVLEKHKLDSLESLFMDRAITVLPLILQGEPFGCLLAVSLKKEIDNIEKNYLKLFAGQIELSVSMTRLIESVQNQAVTDVLTGLFNRRYFDETLAAEVRRSQRSRRPFTLVTLDLDHLKQINDTYGHSAGDAAIALIGSVLLKSARKTDIAARFGGEEFALVLPDTDVESGVEVAERIRSKIESENIEGVGTITASVGVATFLKHANTLEDLVELVDQAMYRAKKNRRNRVEVVGTYEKFDWIRFGLEIFTNILCNKDLPIDSKLADELILNMKSEISEKQDYLKKLYNNVYLLIKNHDPSYLSGFIRMKIELVEKIADKLELAKHETDKIKLASILCDIGNILIPKEILLKEEYALSEEEKKKLYEHPSLMVNIMLKPINKPALENILPAIIHHHENWIGSGYPNKLSGEGIPLGSRIIFLVNTYIDLINKKPYRKAYDVGEALYNLNQGANIHYDGKLVDILSAIVNYS
jgi:diguanylate cyclase (GGDEF)-like protein